MTRQSADGLTVRVKVTNGAPALLVNGKRVRPRMFFGGPGSNPIRVGPEGKRITFEFTANSTAPDDGTMHLRFGQKAGQVWLDDISVVDVETSRAVMQRATFEADERSWADQWIVWPWDEKNTVGKAAIEAGGGAGGSAALAVTLSDPPDGRWPDFHIYHVPNMRIERGRTYRVSLWCRAEPARDLSVQFYRPGATFVHLGGPPSRFESQIKLAADAGVDFVSFVIPTPWPEPGHDPDWSGVDAECDRILRANPKALLLPRFGLDPPAWWAREYPDDMMQWEDGSRRHTAVPASPRYRKDAAERAAALVRHLEERYPGNMAGYHPCGQNTGEWFYEETWGALLNGYARADLEGWRTWLLAHYPDDAALRKAWRDPAASRSGADLPTTEERRGNPNGVLRNPAAERKLLDFAQYQQDAMADFVCETARAVRQASEGRKLVVYFYGYAYEFGGVVLGPSTSGHYAMRRVLECPDIDILCSPISYGDRGLGETGPVMSAAESVALTGAKMWLQEDDTRTHESPDTPDAIARLKTPAETERVLTRNMMNEATRNLATWWMDLGMEGWFDDPGIWDLMKRLEPVDRFFMQNPTPYRPEVASIMDERSMLLIGPNVYRQTYPLTYGARHQLGRMGAPYGQYLQDDVLAGRVKARMYVFHSAWRMSAEDRQKLLRATKGAACVWLYAPGAFDEDGPSPEAMRQLTGFALRSVEPSRGMATPTPVGTALGLTGPIGVDLPVRPLFAAADARPEETLATYEDGSAAIAMRRTGTEWSLFVGVPGLTPELLRVVADKAGVHLYARDNAAVWANGPFVAVQATRDGPVAVRLRSRATVTDAITGERIGAGPSLTLDMRKGDIRVLRVGNR
ncbi:MAG: hypothetical protein GX446_07510 [Chthonomonadales bacterium]|nr:hypothetical protein [Chthonomonadales bacterium]